MTIRKKQEKIIRTTFDSGDQIDKRKSRDRVCVSGYWGNETARIMSQHMLIFYSVNKLPHSGLLLTLFFPHRCKENWNQPGYVVLFERSPPLWQGHHEGPCVWAGNAQRQRGCGGETSARLCFVHQLVHSKGTCAVITFHGLCFMFLKLYVYWHLSLFSCVLSQLQKHFHNKLQNFVLWELKKPN